MDSFEGLAIEKQNVIVDSALSAFGRNGYKKASMSDIACVAGVSKASLFYYFGSKKELYLYLVDLCSNIVITSVEKKLDSSLDDFFARLRAITEIKMETMKQHPAIPSFLKSLYKETDDALGDMHGRIKGMLEKYSDIFLLSSIDFTKFKDGVDPSLVLRFIIWAGEGFVTELPEGVFADQLDSFIEEFYVCLEMMEKNFYMEEYL